VTDLAENGQREIQNDWKQWRAEDAECRG